MDRDETRADRPSEDFDSRDPVSEGETHATTGGAAAAGAVTGGVIGLAGGPVGAAIGAVGGAIVGVAAERMMHSDDDKRHAATEAETMPTSADLTAENTRSSTDSDR
jgi:uncharacterized protein YcfJ